MLPLKTVKRPMYNVLYRLLLNKKKFVGWRGVDIEEKDFEKMIGAGRRKQMWWQSLPEKI